MSETATEPEGAAGADDDTTDDDTDSGQTGTDRGKRGRVGESEGERPSPPETGSRRGSDRETRDDPFDRDRAERTIKQLRAGERDLSKEVKRLTGLLKQREDEELSAVERTQRELERAREELAEVQGKLTERERVDRSRAFRDTITSAAEKAGALRPTVLHRLVDPDQIDLDDDGRPAAPDKVIARLRNEYPELFRSHGGRGNADAAAKGKDQAPSIDDWIRSASGRQ